MTEDVRIFVVDDELDLCRAIERLLRAEGYEVECFQSGEAFLDALRPDAFGCALLDLSMPGIDGLETQRRLAERGARLPVVFLTARGGIPETVRAIKGGAIDFLSKPVRREPLLQALEAAIEQARTWRAADRARDEWRQRLAKLTPREREVFEHVIAGRLNKVIADRLGTSEQTIKVHRGRVMEKLAADSLADLIRIATLLGIEPRA